MTKVNIINLGTQITDLRAVPGRCSLNCQHVAPDQRTAEVDCSNIGNSNNFQNKNVYETLEKTEYKNNQNAIPCYIKSSPTQRG